MQRTRLVFVFWIFLLLLGPQAVAATDCAQRFVPGAFGVLATDPAVRDGLVAVPGFRPIYLEKRSLEESDPALCNYVTVYDVFRLSYQEPRPLLAGCYGDFTGNGRRDYALLLEGKGGEVIPYVFIATLPHDHVFKLPKIADPDGFNADHTLWPGPFCQKKPPQWDLQIPGEWFGPCCRGYHPSGMVRLLLVTRHHEIRSSPHLGLRPPKR